MTRFDKRWLLACVPVTLAVLAGTTQAQQSTRGEFVLVRGTDTVAIESFERDARQLRGEVRQLDGSRLQYVAQLRDDASVATFTAVSIAKDSSATRINASLEPSRLAMVQRDRESTVGRMFDVTRAGHPFYQLSIALTEQILRGVKRPTGSASTALLLRLGFVDTVVAGVVRPTADSAIVTVGQTSIRVALDATGGVIGGVIAPQRIAITRRASHAPPTSPPACNDAPLSPVSIVDVPGNPFQALPTADGCWVFASFPSTTAGWPGGIGLFRRSGGALALERLLPIDGNPTGMALTHDGSLLVVAAGQRIAFVDPMRLIFAQSERTVSYLDEPTTARLGRVYANVSPDDKFAFIADESAQAISVVDLTKARASGFNASSIVGKIPTGAAPIALTFSADATLMYATSQRAPSALSWPIECKREGTNPADTVRVNPQGAIHVIDAVRARTDPANAVIGSVPAGCNAVRLVLSPTGDRAYVTARGSNTLLAFDTGKLRSDPMHAVIGRVSVGTAPVGIAVVDGGRKVIVTNSNRFGGSAGDHQSLTVVDATKISQGGAAVIGSIPAGAFPREMRVTQDGRTLILTNFGSRSIELVDLTRLPLEAIKP